MPGCSDEPPGPTSNFHAARAFAEFGLAEQSAGRRESASGPGSSRAAAEPTLRLLRRSLKRHRISSILDLGCGDWNWMQLLGLPGAGQGLDVSYEGWEASPGLVEALSERHGRPGRIVFRHCDALTADLPAADLVIARDILFHLPLASARALVGRIAARSRWLVATSFLGMPRNADIERYLPIEGWGFHKINLNAAPFGLAECLEEALAEPLCSHSGSRRFICLYDMSRMPA